jgi:hypothetical protein
MVHTFCEYCTQRWFLHLSTALWAASHLLCAAFLTNSAFGQSVRSEALELRGAASCATSSCHNGPRASVASPISPRGSEYSLWLERDPHAASWRTICSNDSLRILTKLGIMKDGSVQNLDAYANCLKCHNTDSLITVEQSTPRLTEGVGCESCHGASQKWYDKHFQSKESKSIAHRDLGLTNLDDLISRARACVSCHVGATDRDMNHDIIAAGHPALYFDFAVYHERLPKHWREERTSVDGQPIDHEARSRLWLAGQVAAAETELALLSTRANRGHAVSVWPELSNYECTSCHVALNGLHKTPENLHRKSVAGGTASPRRWNLGGAEAVASRFQEPILSENLAEIRTLLKAPITNQAAIANQANELRAKIRHCVHANGASTLREWNRTKQADLASKLLVEAQSTPSWEVAAGAYIAAWASLPVSHSPELERAMDTLRRGLLFPLNSQSPKFPRDIHTALPPSSEQWNQALRSAASSILPRK